MIKCFYYEESSLKVYLKGLEAQPIEITSLNFGPYDNGHVIVGLNTGAIFILNSLDLSSMFRYQVFDPLRSPEKNNLPLINNINFDPTQMIFATTRHASEQTNNEATNMSPIQFYNIRILTLIENNAQYKYLEMGQNTYMTLVIPQNKK